MADRGQLWQGRGGRRTAAGRSGVAASYMGDSGAAASRTEGSGAAASRTEGSGAAVSHTVTGGPPQVADGAEGPRGSCGGNLSGQEVRTMVILGAHSRSETCTPARRRNTLSGGQPGNSGLPAVFPVPASTWIR